MFARTLGPLTRRALLAHGMRWGSSLHPLGKEFFNRTHDKQVLLDRFTSKPENITVILGGPSTGKTALLHEVLSDESKFAVAHMNLRATSFFSWHGLYKETVQQFHSLIEKLENKDQSILSKLTFGFGKVKVPEPKEVIDFDASLEEIEKSMPQWGEYRVSKDGKACSLCPVLFIDEANSLDMILQQTDPLVAAENLKALKSFFDWCVLMTKQTRMHVVFGSSDSFFWHWLANPESKWCLFV